MRILLAIPALLAAAGCYMYPHPPPPPPPPELGRPPAACEATIFPLNTRITAATVDKFTGRYARGADTLIVARQQHRLLVTRPGFGTREITAPDAGGGQWYDACGVQYRFTLPPDGPGAVLRITDLGGVVGDWNRTGH